MEGRILKANFPKEILTIGDTPARFAGRVTLSHNSRTHPLHGLSTQTIMPH